MAALTKLDLAIGLSERIGLSRVESKEIVELFFEEIRKSLECGENVHISGFGNFDLRDKDARPGRNPRCCLDLRDRWPVRRRDDQPAQVRV